MSNHALNREVRWDAVNASESPSGWGNIEKPNAFDKTVHFFYEKLQFRGARKPHREADRYWPTDPPKRLTGMTVPRDISTTGGESAARHGEGGSPPPDRSGS